MLDSDLLVGTQRRPERRRRRAEEVEMLDWIVAFFRGLFARKPDDFKDLLIADLGIER